MIVTDVYKTILKKKICFGAVFINGISRDRIIRPVEKIILFIRIVQDKIPIIKFCSEFIGKIPVPCSLEYIRVVAANTICS